MLEELLNNQEKNDDDFQRKIDELYKFANINNLENNKIDPILLNNNEKKSSINNQINSPININNQINSSLNNIINDIDIKKELHHNPSMLYSNSSEQSYKKNIVYGIKKTILSDYNSLYMSSNSSDFKIGVNKNINQNRTIYDCFYLFPNISEINTKNETNIINEKKVEYFENKIEPYDIQYFPIDFIPCGINIPMKTSINIYNKFVIIFMNIY